MTASPAIVALDLQAADAASALAGLVGAALGVIDADIIQARAQREAKA